MDAPIKESQQKDAQIKDVQPVGTKSQAAPPSLPIDQPPNLDQPADKMAASAPSPIAPSENVTLNLINRLVQRGILTKEDAGDLIRQAKEDAQRASQQSQVAQQAATQAATAQQMAMEAAAPPSSDESVSVSYVPEIVKSEMRDEIKRDVIAAAQSEGWATPNYPSWINNLRPFMDLRTRYQGNNYGSDNSTDLFETVNFNAINTGQPFNMMQIPWQTSQGALPSQFANIPQSQVNAFGQYIGGPGAPTPITPPTYNTTQNRQLARVRFRFGADMDLGENFTSGFRIGTGQNGSPVSENQTFGFVGNQGNAQGGNFSSYAIWLDRAFLKYEIGSDPDRLAAITVGRFDNPFYTPTTIMWANDIGFDGVAAQARYKIFKGFTPFATAGIFPIFNTDLNFPANSTTKVQSNDKYLYAAQVGIDWKITKDINFKSSVGYYNFQNVAGKVSSPGVTPNADSPLDTDDSRPTFAQRGNTYVQLRNIQKVDATDEYGNIINAATGNYYYNSLAPDDPTQNYYVNQFQYFGLATPYNIFSANARLEYRHWEPFVVSVSGEWDRNLAWNSQNIVNNGPVTGPDNNYNQMLVTGPVNNLVQNSGGVYNYNGGNTAWIIQGKIGSGALQKRWDWDLGVSYRYVESDAVIDGFCDSDFGGGGTNLKGFAVGGNLALSKNVFLGARWMSATGIAGPTYKADILQLDLNARF
jgi:polyhydroxyalkanoate synthesis regulator phasin